MLVLGEVGGEQRVYRLGFFQRNRVAGVGDGDGSAAGDAGHVLGFGGAVGVVLPAGDGEDGDRRAREFFQDPSAKDDRVGGLGDAGRQGREFGAPVGAKGGARGIGGEGVAEHDVHQRVDQGGGAVGAQGVDEGGEFGLAVFGLAGAAEDGGGQQQVRPAGGEAQCDEAAERVADEVDGACGEGFDEGGGVVGECVEVERGGRGAAALASVVIADDAVGLGEMGGLVVEHGEVEEEGVGEDDGRAGAGLFDVKVGGVGHGVLRGGVRRLGG